MEKPIELTIQHKMELIFWNTIIFNLSRFRLFRHLLSWAFQLFDQTDVFAFTRSAVIVSLFGFTFGFGLTYLLSLLM